MLEKQKAWKRETGFDRLEIIVEIHAQRLHAGFDSEPLYTGLYNPKRPHSPEKYKLQMDVELERLRFEIFFLQPAPPPQYSSSPRRSPAVGAGSDEPGVPHDVTKQTEQAGTFPFQADVNDSLHVNCTSPEQEAATISLQTDVGVNDETTITTAQAAAHEESARPPKNWQQRRVTAWGAEQIKQFDPEG